MARSGVMAGMAALALGLAAPASATADLTKLSAAVAQMGALNTIVFGNLTAAHDIEGKAWVGGNASGTFNVGIGSQTGKGSASSTYSTLTVGGNVTGTININNGTTTSGNTVAANGGISNGVGTGYGATVGGNAGTLNFNSQNTAAGVAIGGTASGVSVGANSRVNVVGGAGSISVGNGSTINAGGDVASLTMGTNVTARIVGNAGSGAFNPQSGDTIYIGGQLQTQNLNGFGGNVYTNGARYGSTQNPAPSDYHFNQNNTITAPVSPASAIASQKSSFVDDLTYLSYGLSTLASSATLTSPGNSISTATYGSKSYVVFNIADSAAFFSQSGDLSTLLANMPSTTSVIINVAGTSITQGNGLNFNSISYSQDLLWNFYQATSVNLGNFYGTVLAPNATVSNSNAINGSVIASVFNQNGEVHLGTFQGNMTEALKAITVADPAGAVPEPGSWAMMMLGFGAIGGMIRRQKQSGLLPRF